MMREELAITADPRAPHWHKDEVAPDRPFLVAVVGAGMSGIIAAYRLARPTCPTSSSRRTTMPAARGWRTPIPGAASTSRTTTTATRSPSAMTGRTSTRPQGELHPYFRHCVDESRDPAERPLRHRGVVDRVRRRSRAVDALPRRAGWCRGDARGGRRDQRVGQLNRPQLPNIEGRETFAGPSFHSARWDHTVDLAGKRVAVVGTGCSLAQFAPIIAEQVADLEVFQRTPSWAVPGSALPPRGAGRDAVAASPRPVLPAVVPVLAVLARRRTAPPDGRGRPRISRAGTIGQRAQPHAGHAHRAARGPVPRAAGPPAQGHPRYHRRQADHRRRTPHRPPPAHRQRRRLHDRPHRPDQPNGIITADGTLPRST